MMGTTTSRWTMAHIAAALVSFILAQALMAAGFSYPGEALTSGETLITVHLLTIGWLSVLILGALYQFVPVITTKPLASEGAALAALAAILTGLALMVVGFAAFSAIGAPGLIAVLPVGGTLVVAGFAIGAANIGATLWRARPLVLSARFVAAGLGFLVLTGLLGLTFAVALAAPEVPAPLAALVAGGLSVHVVGGIGGWFTLTAMGVSYRLLSMFMLAPEEEGRVGDWAFGLAAGGILLWWCAGLAAALGAGAAAPALWTGQGLAGVGLALYLVDMLRLYRTRRRRELELNSRTAAAALVALVTGVALWIGGALAGRLGDLAGPLAYLFAFGWLSGLALGQLYKIVPFITWLQRYGPLLGKGPVPRVQDLVDERRAAPWFVLYFGAVCVAAAGLLAGQALLWRIGVAGHLAATLLIARELWRARYGTPATRPAGAAPRPFPTRTDKVLKGGS